MAALRNPFSTSIFSPIASSISSTSIFSPIALRNPFSTSTFSPIASSISSTSIFSPFALRNPLSTSIFSRIASSISSASIFSPIASSISSLWKKKMPKDNHDPPSTPNTVEIPMQPLIRSSRTDDVIHGDVVADVGAPLAPIAPTVNTDSSSKHIQKMVVAVAIFLMTFASLLIVNPPDASRMSDSLAESMASISNVLLPVTFGFGASLILHNLLCLHSSDHLNHIRVQKHLMLMGVVFMALSLLFRTLVTPSGTPLVIGSWVLALLVVVIAFAFLWMVSRCSAGMAAPGLAAGGLDNLPV